MNFIRQLMKLLFPLLITPVLSAQQYFPAGLNAPLQTSEKDSTSSRALLADRDQWQEVVTERKLNSSTYITPDGRVIVHTCERPINYYRENGDLVPINSTLSPMENGGWSATDQPHPVYFYSDGSMALSTLNGELFSFGNNCKVNGTWNFSGNISVEDNRCLMNNVVPGVNRIVEMHENAVKYSYVITQPLNISTTDFSVSEELNIPHGMNLQNDVTYGRKENDGWKGDMILVDAEKNVNATLHLPIVYDANHQWTLGTYKTEIENGKTILEISIPASWLNDPSRTYPVTIDPLITGPTALWVGGYMPSCLAPAYNSDSILVTLPGQISVTGLVVTSSFYADPFTTAIMADGAMWFSTVCNISQVFTIPIANGGNLPGTAYLDTFNMRSPLMCCFPQSCSQSTFYLRMHLQRTQPGAGCNTTYIRHDPFTTLWPFQAFVVGHTVEKFGNGFSVQAAGVCSRNCTFTGTAYFKYGVPPFTVTHPWLSGPVVVGTPVGCSFATTIQSLTFHIPNCPVFCDTSTSLFVSPPVITDACGNTVTGLVGRYLTIKPTPDITASPDPETVCSGTPYNIALTSCLNGSAFTWTTVVDTGNGNISGNAINNSTTDSTTNYTAYATLNGCYSDTIHPVLVIAPDPSAAFTFAPQPFIAGVAGNFIDQSNYYSGTPFAWFWDFGDTTLLGTSQNPVHTYTHPGTHTVCLIVETSQTCLDTICQDVDVIPAEVEAVNVVTPNGDGINDHLQFKYLEYYASNHLDIYDRWGVLLYSKNNYANDWDGSKYSDGTYYYILSVQDTKKNYKGFFEIIK
ncbi:MAG: gliding motility-associated C-terminal domain-containing protein [Bacteroidetes bacterium]|nr:gliding motility-associated C-terminal domain-containing protein [Bacteroidota bacterium]